MVSSLVLRSSALFFAGVVFNLAAACADGGETSTEAAGAAGTGAAAQSGSGAGQTQSAGGTGGTSTSTTSGAGGAGGMACGPAVDCATVLACEGPVSDTCGGTTFCDCSGCPNLACDNQQCGCNTDFTDAPLGVHQESIECLAAKCLVAGKSDGSFDPQGELSRGQIAVLLSRTAKLTDAIAPGTQTFDDVPSSHVFWTYIERIAKAGITSGKPSCSNTVCSGACFCANDPVTRGQAAKLIAIGLSLPLASPTFSDTQGTLFEQYIGALQQAGVANGSSSCETSSCSNNCYCPGDPLRRGQGASFLARAIDCLSYCQEPAAL